MVPGRGFVTSRACVSLRPPSFPVLSEKEAGYPRRSLGPSEIAEKTFAGRLTVVPFRVGLAASVGGRLGQRAVLASRASAYWRRRLAMVRR